MAGTETKKQRLGKMEVQLKDERSSFDSHWRELGEHILPRRIRFFDQDRNRGDKRNQKILNAAGTLAARTLRSGMMAGMSSPARPWRRLTTPDPDLAEFGAVKEWLFTVNKRMNTLDLQCNLYNALPTIYGDAGVFATSAMIMVDDPEDIIRFHTFPIGSFWIACDDRGIPDTFMREFQMTVRQMVMMFGDPQAPEGKRWANFSHEVKRAWDEGHYEQLVSVVHYINANVDYQPDRLQAKYKKWASCYYEAGTQASMQGYQREYNDDVFLRESGFDRFPVLAPRWDVTGLDPYGTSCPGMEGLPDIKELQMLTKKKKRALEKQIDPSLVGPTALRTQKTSLLAGDITYVDERDGSKGLRPIHEVSIALRDVMLDIAETERRISRAFYEDLFLMMVQSDRREITAREIDERHEEKLLALGQVLERFNDELFDPLTDLEFDKMVQAGWVPKPPREIQGMDLRVEYVSIMAQAQKLVGVAGTDRFMAFLGNLAALYPPGPRSDVLDKVDPDNLVDEYADRMGVSAKIVNDDEEVEQLRRARAKAQQQAAMAASMPQLADTAKTLSETDTTRESALSQVMAGR